MSVLGTVYFIQECEAGPVKIGWTAGAPTVRLAALQTGNSRQLSIVAAQLGVTAETERFWHKHFAASHLRAEWFDCTPEVAEVIALYRWVDPRLGHPVSKYLKASGLSREELSERAGISRTTLWRIMSGKGEHSTATLKAVSDATGNAVTLAQLVESKAQSEAA